jgi:hypothetical protein
MRNEAYLAEPDWSLPAWSTLIKNPTENLMDIMAQLPKIAINGYIARQSTDASIAVEKTVAIAKACQQLESRFIEWHEKLKTDTLGPLFWREPSELYSLSRESALPELDIEEYYFPERFWYSDTETAYAHLLYWTSLQYLYNTYCITWVRLQRLPGYSAFLQSATLEKGNFSFPPNPLLYSNAHACACNISQSLEYFIMTEKTGGIGAGRIAFPISVAKGFFENTNAPEQTYFGVVLRFLRQKYGIPLDKFLESMFNDAILKLS